MASPSTSRRSSAALLLAVTLLLVGFAAAIASGATAADDVASLAARLAKDADSLAAARAEHADVEDQLVAIRAEHRRLRTEVEGRLVAIYKFGGGGNAIERIASGESVADVGRTLDALDFVAKNDARLLARWQRLDRKRRALLKRRAALEDSIDRLEDRVSRTRERLSAAEARLAAARREAERLARVKENPLIPHYARPENAAAAATGAKVATSQQPVGYSESGMASYYHDSFAGEKTSDGETYDPNAFTAAHPTLPFGTWVTVTGPTGSVQVRINDRGPFVGGRVIDLSRAAAQAIGVTLSPVTISVVA